MPGPAIALLLLLVAAGDAHAQLGALLSPGRLAQAHAELEGVTNCLQCHSAGRQVAADKCLSCHKPVAERLARKAGVHRNVTTDCVTCHVEHAGAEAELRPFDTSNFNHRTETGYALDGLHAPLAQQCASCHKTRSFLTVSTSCASCHADTHKGSLGATCATCHSTAVRFTQATSGFNHTQTAFPLTGAHATVACASCHVNKVYKGVAFASCANCHQNPHQPRLPGECSSCHTTGAWRTTKVDHARTAFPLRGKHAEVACAQCHVRPALAVKPKSDTCASCHADPHKGVFKQDCSACHDEATFKKGIFDHATTRFPLVDKHAGLACVDCHRGATGVGGEARQKAEGTRLKAEGTRKNTGVAPVLQRTALATAGTATDFSGLHTNCDSCHTDVHRVELGTACESCHTAKSFEVTPFTHAKPRPFFAGQHATVTCQACHIETMKPVRVSVKEPAPRVGFVTTATACASCHADVHLGQVRQTCESCHAIETADFGVVGFSHAATTFPLKGKHAPVACDGCHKVETRAFPAGTGAARRLTGMGTACAACHQDPHAGQLKDSCQDCHTEDSFHITKYTHRNQRRLRDFFTGRHVSPPCAACHKPTAQRATATAIPVVGYAIPTTCTTCHTDIHRGSLGSACETCHRP
ncbi:MAG: hypothetical protein AB7H81_17025 [Vicinamibacterales bacterium]